MGLDGGFYQGTRVSPPTLTGYPLFSLNMAEKADRRILYKIVFLLEFLIKKVFFQMNQDVNPHPHLWLFTS